MCLRSGIDSNKKQLHLIKAGKIPVDAGRLEGFLGDKFGRR